MPTLFLEILVMIVVELQKLKEAVSEECFEVNRLYVRPTIQILVACIDPNAFLVRSF